jgi:hypothetical protein
MYSSLGKYIFQLFSCNFRYFINFDIADENLVLRELRFTFHHTIKSANSVMYISCKISPINDGNPFNNSFLYLTPG